MSGIPVNNFIDRVNGQVASGAITPQQGAMLIADARETAGSDGMLSYREREGLSADLRADKEYNAQFNQPTPQPQPNPNPAPTPITNNESSPAFRVSAPPPIPQNTLEEKTTYVAPTGIKQATPDIIVFDEKIDPEFLTQAFFQEFGGTELINISRYDLINGEDVSYTPIINLSILRQNFNPNNIIAISALQDNPTKYGIDLFSRGVIDPYFNENGDLVIEINEVRPEESIEVQIASDGTINRIEL